MASPADGVEGVVVRSLPTKHPRGDAPVLDVKFPDGRWRRCRAVDYQHLEVVKYELYQQYLPGFES